MVYRWLEDVASYVEYEREKRGNKKMKDDRKRSVQRQVALLLSYDL